MKKTVSALVLAATAALSAQAFASLPDLPVALKLGSGAISDGVIYAGLGTAGQDWFRLDTKAAAPKWEKVAKFIGTPRDQSQAVAIDGKIYVFGGCGKADENAEVISVLNDVYAYDIKNDSWEKVMTRSPRGMTGHAAVSADGKTAIIVGSVNKPIFDGFFEDLNAAAGDQKLLEKINKDYIGKPIADYYFNRDVMQYDPAANLWHNLGQMPTSGTAGSAIATDGKTVTIVGGERKPGLRTAAALSFEVKDSLLIWKQLPDLVPPADQSVQEGVAGAFSGVLDNAVLVAGGANFPGSTAAYAKGKNFAHEGCTKTWRDEIYALDEGKWTIVGALPEPLGYGITIANGDQLILLGGETTGGKAVSQVITLSYKDGKAVIGD